MPAQASIQFPCPRLLDSRFRGHDARRQVLAVYVRNGHQVVCAIRSRAWRGGMRLRYRQKKPDYSRATGRKIGSLSRQYTPLLHAPVVEVVLGSLAQVPCVLRKPFSTAAYCLQ